MRSLKWLALGAGVLGIACTGGNGDDTGSEPEEEDCLRTFVYYRDVDKDGLGSNAPEDFIRACELPAGYTEFGGDCDDSSAAVGGASYFYEDADGDGFGNRDESEKACEASEGWVANAKDCDDDDAEINPNAQEVCNYEYVDGGGKQLCADRDGDGLFGPDDDPDAVPIECPAASIPVDENCNGKADDLDSATLESSKGTWFADNDEDGFAADDATVILVCLARSEMVTDLGDCQDEDSTVSPDMQDVCNDQVDNDCDGEPAPECLIKGGIISDDGHASGRRIGSATNEHLGTALSFVGDVNGDLTPDIAVGEPGDGISSGQVYLVLGPMDDSAAIDASGGAKVTYYGSSTFWVGSNVAGAGDFDGNGFGEWVAQDSKSSQAMLFIGSGSPSSTPRALYYRPSGSTSVLGHGVDGGTDLTGDGLADIQLGMHDGSEQGVVVYTSIGTTAANFVDVTKSSTVVENCNYGQGQFASADMDSDGFADLLCTNTDTGSAYLLNGPLASAPGDGTVGVENAFAASEYAAAGSDQVRVVGDVDGDGYPDAAVESDAGVWTIWNGGKPGLFSSTLATIQPSGTIPDIAQGDVDYDDHSDLIVGAPDLNTVYIFWGDTISGTMTTADIEIYGTTGKGGGDEFGCSVAANADLNGDSFVDFVVGSCNSLSGTGEIWTVLGGGF